MTGFSSIRWLDARSEGCTFGHWHFTTRRGADVGARPGRNRGAPSWTADAMRLLGALPPRVVLGRSERAPIGGEESDRRLLSRRQEASALLRGRTYESRSQTYHCTKISS